MPDERNGHTGRTDNRKAQHHKATPAGKRLGHTCQHENAQHEQDDGVQRTQLGKVGGIRHIPVHDARQQPCGQQNGQCDCDATRQGEQHHAFEETGDVAACVRCERQDERRNADGQGPQVGDVAWQIRERDLREHHAERD